MTGLKGIYSIYDKKAGLFFPPFMEATDGTAIRKMQDMVADNNPNNVFNHHAEDFDLVKVAEFGELSGSIKAINKEVLMNLGKLKQGE